MPSGGPRAGSGRPPRAQVYGAEIRDCERKIVDKLPSLVDNMLRLSEGVWVEEDDPITGKRIVYRKGPDRQANEYLINRILGKPTERKEISGPDGEAIKHDLSPLPTDELRQLRDMARKLDRGGPEGSGEAS